MTRFTDGPAAGQTLMLQRAPMFLRVVQSVDGKWDALDQPDDAPEAQETLYAYERLPGASQCHINRGGGKGGWYVIATYRHVGAVAEETMRDTEAWQDWCRHAQHADRCRSCNAPVVWLRTEKGKTVPVDAATVAAGETIYCGKTKKNPERPHVSHFGTCRDAASWSRKK